MNFAQNVFFKTKDNFSLPLTSPPPYNNKDFDRKSLKKKAFTLAETLITLAIIGVVAALTVPTLMSNYQKQEIITKLKKTQSTLSNATKLMVINSGCSSGDFDCTGFNDNSLVYDGITFSNTSNKKLYMIGSQFKKRYICLPESPDNNLDICKNSRYIISVPGITFTSGTNSLVLEDGTILRLAGIYYSYGDKDQGLPIVVDINGAKGPNSAGKDIFQFYLAPTTNNGIEAGSVFPYKSAAHAAYAENPYAGVIECGTENPNALDHALGKLDCAAKILKEGAVNYKI